MDKCIGESPIRARCRVVVVWLLVMCSYQPLWFLLIPNSCIPGHGPICQERILTRTHMNSRELTCSSARLVMSGAGRGRYCGLCRKDSDCTEILTLEMLSHMPSKHGSRSPTSPPLTSTLFAATKSWPTAPTTLLPWHCCMAPGAVTISTRHLRRRQVKAFLDGGMLERRGMVYLDRNSIAQS